MYNYVFIYVFVYKKKNSSTIIQCIIISISPRINENVNSIFEQTINHYTHIEFILMLSNKP